MVSWCAQFASKQVIFAQWIKHQTLNTWMTPGVGSSPTGAKIFVTLLVPLGKALYSNCSVVRRSRKAVGPVYMYLNINTSVHVKERHRLNSKGRRSSRYCWLYFKTTLIYSWFQSMGQGWLWPIWVPKNKYSLFVRSVIILRHMRSALSL